MKAAYYGYENICHYLVENGSDLKLKDGEGRTVADLALKNGYRDIAKQL